MSPRRELVDGSGGTIKPSDSLPHCVIAASISAGSRTGTTTTSTATPGAAATTNAEIILCAARDKRVASLCHRAGRQHYDGSAAGPAVNCDFGRDSLETSNTVPTFFR